MITQAEKLIDALKALSTEANREGMKRFGIDASKALGVRMPDIRAIAKKVKKDRSLADALWQSGIHEARILSGLVDDPSKLSPDDADRLVSDFYSWDICDQCCMNLLEKTPFALEKIYLWADSEKEFTRRTAFSLIAVAAVHWKDKDDSFFEQFFPLIEKYSNDERNFVKKSVNWALRQIGKRSPALRQKAMESADTLLKSANKTARWIASDAIREFRKKTF